ncbi:MAG: flagellar hook-length control protein FliK [Lachnospiraceae bacterium]|nr:flagellar hook-length control protein FliK [Lachnospiraceae bacterium]
MNIRVNSNLLNNNQVTDTSQTQQTAAPRLGATLARQISDMNVGDVFTGKITDLTGQSLQLLLSDKSQISAKLSAMMKLQVGQTMSFEVTSNAGGKVQLTPLYANLTGENQVAKALGEAGLPYDARTSEMVKSMMEQGMKIDADSLLDMARTVNNYPDAAPASIVNMKALDIPLNAENVQQFEIYRNNAHQIAEHVGGIAEGFSEVAGESPAVNNMLLDIFVGEADPAIGELLRDAKALAAEAEGVGETAPTDANGADNTAEEAASASNEAGAVYTASQGETSDKGAVTVNGQTVPEGTVAEGAAQTEITVKDNTAKPNFYGDNTVTDTLEELYTPEEKEKLAEDLNKLGVPKNLTDKLQNNELSTKDTLNLVRNAISQGNEELSGENLQQFTENVKHMLKTPEYSKLVKNEIMNELLMKPEDVADKEKVQEYFQRVVRDTAKAQEILQSTGRGDTTLAAANQDLHDNIDFMNQMNQVFTYMQMPLKMASEAQHGDLYIYTNKKKLQSGDGNVSALLHLDMTHLGTMDVHVSMNPEGVVNTHFILQDESMIDFIAEHLPELDDRINRRGYHMHSDVSLNSEKKTVPEIMFDKGKNAKLIQYTAFDAKA